MKVKHTCLYLPPQLNINPYTVPSNTKKKVKVITRQAEVGLGVPGRLRPRIFRHYKGGRSSAKRTGRLYPRRNPWYLFSEALSEGITEKIPSDTTGDRSRDRPTSSAVS